MSKTDDFERKIKKLEMIEKIEKRIEKRREKYNIIINSLDKDGFDPSTGNVYVDKQAIERRKTEEREKFYNYLEKEQNVIVEIESDIYDFEESEEEIEEEKERKPKYKRFNKAKTVIAAIALVTATAIGTTAITTKINHEKEINRKISSYSKDIDQIVEDASYTRLGNSVFKDGENIEYVDTVANSENQCVEYSTISNYIMNSEDPDLALFTLYRLYGHSSLPRYHRIVTNTFKGLEFEGSETGSMDNFNKYLEENGYNNHEEYYKACKKELISDGDNKLDNLKLKLKKGNK